MLQLSATMMSLVQVHLIFDSQLCCSLIHHFFLVVVDVVVHFSHPFSFSSIYHWFFRLFLFYSKKFCPMLDWTGKNWTKRGHKVVKSPTAAIAEFSWILFSSVLFQPAQHSSTQLNFSSISAQSSPTQLSPTQFNQAQLG